MTRNEWTDQRVVRELNALVAYQWKASPSPNDR